MSSGVFHVGIRCDTASEHFPTACLGEVPRWRLLDMRTGSDPSPLSSVARATIPPSHFTSLLVDSVQCETQTIAFVPAHPQIRFASARWSRRTGILCRRTEYSVHTSRTRGIVADQCTPSIAVVFPYATCHQISIPPNALSTLYAVFSPPVVATLQPFNRRSELPLLGPCQARCPCKVVKRIETYSPIDRDSTSQTQTWRVYATRPFCNGNVNARISDRARWT